MYANCNQGLPKVAIGAQRRGNLCRRQGDSSGIADLDEAPLQPLHSNPSSEQAKRRLATHPTSPQLQQQRMKKKRKIDLPLQTLEQQFKKVFIGPVRMVLHSMTESRVLRREAKFLLHLCLKSSADSAKTPAGEAISTVLTWWNLRGRKGTMKGTRTTSMSTTSAQQRRCLSAGANPNIAPTADATGVLAFFRMQKHCGTQLAKWCRCDRWVQVLVERLA